MQHIKILIVDDDARFREILRGILSDDPDLEVIGEAVRGETGILLAGKLKPDVVLMDIRMPGMNGLEATRLLKKDMPDLRTIMLTIFDINEYKQAALKAGAVSYVEKKSINEDLIPAIKEACTDKLQGTNVS